jgi:hypothetical protein
MARKPVDQTELIAYLLGKLTLGEIAAAHWSPLYIHCTNCGCDKLTVDRDRELAGFSVTCCDGGVDGA